MHIDRAHVTRISTEWRTAAVILGTHSDDIETADLPWATDVADAVADFTASWRDVLGQLAAEADAASTALRYAAAHYGRGDEMLADLIRGIAQAE